MIKDIKKILDMAIEETADDYDTNETAYAFIPKNKLSLVPQQIVDLMTPKDTCPECKGTGEYYYKKNHGEPSRCIHCHGTGKVEPQIEGLELTPEEIPYKDDVHLAAGVYDGLRREAFIEGYQTAVKKALPIAIQAERDWLLDLCDLDYQDFKRLLLDRKSVRESHYKEQQ